jgi:predicted ATPase/class 3 adenylate cyclase
MREDLPSGTVTFLFTDVEGSTRLLHELGAGAYAEALAEHRRVIREACAAEGGVEVDTQGDAFFFAFPTAPGAIAAAAALTEELAAGPIAVRVGLHTGTPLVTDEGYVGGDVHRAARIAAAGHGGQVVVSGSTAPLVEPGLVDLGEHRFKDLAAPERVYQLGDREFPPLKTLYRTNLPIPAHPLVGRKKELVDVMRLLHDARMVTLTGPGGVGKTRFAVAVAGEISDSFPDGVWFVRLAPLRDPKLVLPSIAAAVGAKDDLVLHLGSAASLVVLDNLEQVIEAAPEIAELVSRCPEVRLLVTSRESLRVAPEREYVLAPLPESPSVELFRQRAGAVASELEVEYADAAAICDRVDRLPLAIELAAARCKALAPGQILERLSERLDLLRGGRDADPRQQTLRATIEWSYDLLSSVEQQVFGRLSVFAGGSTLEAAETVGDADLDTLQSLVEKSLLRFTNARYWMLETIRELATEKLEATEAAADVRRRHAEYFLELAQTLGLTMESLERVRVQRHDVAIAEQDNFRAAIDWAFDVDLALAVRIAFSLENFWVTHDPQEGIRRFDAFLERGDELPPELEAAAHRCRGNVRVWSGDRAGAVDDYETARVTFDEIGDEVGALLVAHRVVINREVGVVEERRRDLEALRERFRALGFEGGEALALGSLSGIEHHLGNKDREAELLEEASARTAAIGFTWAERTYRERLASLELERGRTDSARAQGERALELATQAGDRLGIVYGLTFFTRLAVAVGDNERAGLLWGAIEAEGERGSLGLWTVEERPRVESTLPADDADFARGCERGRRLSLDAAMEAALASID